MIPPINPCGLACDDMRSAYKTMVKFYKDSDELTEIMWYRVPKGTPRLPFGSIYASWNWQDANASDQAYMARGTIGQGEQLGAARTWTNGSPPPGFVQGDRPCGTEAQWAGDLSLARDGQGVLGWGDWPVCCGGIPICPEKCENMAFGHSCDTYRVTCEGAVDGAFPYSQLNGTYDVNRPFGGSNCSWIGPGHVGFQMVWRAVVQANNLLRIGMDTVPFGLFLSYGTYPNWDGGPVTVALEGNGIKTGLPPTVLFEPTAGCWLYERVTEEGDFRLTEDGAYRILEDSYDGSPCA